MSSARIVGRVRSCGECPKRAYWSGGKYECSVIGQPLTDTSGIPAFCPLPLDPSALMAKSAWEEKNVTTIMQAAANEAMATADVDRMRHLVLTAASMLGITPAPQAKEGGGK